RSLAALRSGVGADGIAPPPSGSVLAPPWRPMGREPTVPSDLLVGIHVLVVEDNADARDLFKTILQYAGALVTVSSGAEQALQMCEQILPDVMLTDIAMPDRDGFWLVSELRRRGQGRR